MNDTFETLTSQELSHDKEEVSTWISGQKHYSDAASIFRRNEIWLNTKRMFNDVI